jgi:GxxExxY protein
MNLEHEALTEKIIGAAIEVHKKLGPGFLESIYENALAIEFEKRGIHYKRQHEKVIKYDDYEVGKHRFDYIVENEIIVELKTIKKIEDIHFATVRSYLKSINKNHGLIFNFSKMPLEIKRVIYK